jgi:hypothetical protein
MDMDTYIPEEHIIQSENNDNSITEDQVELIDTSLNVVTSYDRFLKSEPIPKRKHPQPSQLPETVTVLNDNITNGTIYLVGTAHFRFEVCFFLLKIISYFLVKKVNEKSQKYIQINF